MTNEMVMFFSFFFFVFVEKKQIVNDTLMTNCDTFYVYRIHTGKVKEERERETENRKQKNNRTANNFNRELS